MAPADTMPSEVAMSGAAVALWSDLYGNLKQLARSRLRRSGPMTLLDTTGLVNDAYLKMAAGQRLAYGNSQEFLAYASRVMRSVVVDLVRARQAERRGGGAEQITLNTEVIGGVATGEELLQVDQALENLARLEPRLCQVVEMRYFGGFTENEIGAVLGLTDRTVRRDWEKARLLLRVMITE